MTVPDDDSPSTLVVRAASPDEPFDTIATHEASDTVSHSPAGDAPSDERSASAATENSGWNPAVWHGLGEECSQLASELFQDAELVYTNKQNLVALLAAGGASYLAHQEWDDRVAAYTAQHPNRWGRLENVIGGIGNPANHFAAIGGLYFYSLYTQDESTHELSTTLLHAVSISGLSTILLKSTVGLNTTAPNGEPDPFGGAWPSGHTSSSFAVAAVLDEYYGSSIGVPAYILAALVGWERIDDREHDLSDVLFGAALGYVIGKTIAADHHLRFCGMDLQPLIDPETGTTGVCFERRF